MDAHQPASYYDTFTKVALTASPVVARQARPVTPSRGGYADQYAQRSSQPCPEFYSSSVSLTHMTYRTDMG